MLPTGRTAAIEDEILELLRGIPEPCSLLMRGDHTIVDMGLVEDIDVHDGHAAITLVLTDVSCIHFRGMRAYITDVVAGHPHIDTVDVRVSTATLWMPDRVLGS